MKKRAVIHTRATGLRELAEKVLARRGGEPGRRGEPVSSALRRTHELEVHQIELQIQNEELQAARHELEAAVVRYTELFDFAPIGYAMLGLDGSIVAINHAGAELLGQPRSRLIDSNLGRFVSEKDRTRLQALLLAALESEVKESCEVDLLPRAGKGRQARLTAAVLFPQKVTALVALQDVTEARSREAALAHTDAALREANRRKDEFLAVLSHELRNPLAPISNSLFVLDREDATSEQRRKALMIIERQVTQLARLIDDLLDVNRIARGKIELRRERFDLAQSVRRTLDDQQAGFEANGVTLESSFEPGAFWIDADPIRLNQAVSNLLGNALKFTPPGGRVSVTLQRQGRDVAVRIRDTGSGIEPSVLPGLFQPFAQAPQTMDRARGGLGLGLATARGLIELHGGTISMSSAGLGEGTEVVILLSLAADPAQGVSIPESSVTRGRRVLLIEDNQDAVETLKEALVLSGHHVQVALDGPQGLELARKFEPEVVICDIGLPGMDGYDVARAFRVDEKLKLTYLLALSGYARPEDHRRAMDAGFNQHLAKPATMRELNVLLAQAPTKAQGVCGFGRRTDSAS